MWINIFGRGKENLSFDELEKFIEKNDKFYPSKIKVKALYEDLKKLSGKYSNDEELKQIMREFRQLLNNVERLEVIVRQIYKLALEGLVHPDILVYFVDFIRNWTGKYIDLRQFRRETEKWTKKSIE